MAQWTWQKWVGKLLPFVLALAAAIWELIEQTPGWWPTISAALVGIVQWVLSVFPPKKV